MEWVVTIGNYLLLHLYIYNNKKKANARINGGYEFWLLEQMCETTILCYKWRGLLPTI